MAFPHSKQKRKPASADSAFSAESLEEEFAFHVSNWGTAQRKKTAGKENSLGKGL